MLTLKTDWIKPNKVDFQELLVSVPCKQFFDYSSVYHVGPCQCVCLTVMLCGKYFHKADDESSRDRQHWIIYNDFIKKYFSKMKIKWYIVLHLSIRKDNVIFKTSEYKRSCQKKQISWCAVWRLFKFLEFSRLRLCQFRKQFFFLLYQDNFDLHWGDI